VAYSAAVQEAGGVGGTAMWPHRSLLTESRHPACPHGPWQTLFIEIHPGAWGCLVVVAGPAEGEEQGGEQVTDSTHQQCGVRSRPQ